jgi:RNA polymerase sigma-70 factor (ECF subfamily)
LKSSLQKREFSLLVRECLPKVYGLAFRMVNDADVARDLLQDSMIKAWKNYTNFDRNRSFAVWLSVIVLNTCKDYLKSPYRKLEKGDATEMATRENQQEKMERHEQHMLIVSLAAHLPLKQKEVFILHDLQGYPLAEVEKEMGLKKGVARSHLYYARKKLKEQLIHHEKQERARAGKMHR